MSDKLSFEDAYVDLQKRLATMKMSLRDDIHDLQIDYFKQRDMVLEEFYKQYPDARPTPIGTSSFVEHMMQITPDDGTGQPVIIGKPQYVGDDTLDVQMIVGDEEEGMAGKPGNKSANQEIAEFRAACIELGRAIFEPLVIALNRVLMRLSRWIND